MTSRTYVSNPYPGQLRAASGELASAAAPLLILGVVFVIAKAVVPDIENVLHAKLTALLPSAPTTTTTTTTGAGPAA